MKKSKVTYFIKDESKKLKVIESIFAFSEESEIKDAIIQHLKDNWTLVTILNIETI